MRPCPKLIARGKTLGWIGFCVKGREMYGFSEVGDGLPILGVGLSLSFGMQPDPVELAAMPRGPSFIEYAGVVQKSWVEGPVTQLEALGIPVLYHPSCLNLCGPFANPPHWLAAVDAHVQGVKSPWLAQDVAICFARAEGGYSIELGYFIPPILSRTSLEQAILRVMEVRRAVQAPLLLEPAPVTFQLGDMSIFEWLGELAERTDCGLLLDAGHVVSHQLSSGRGLLDGLDALDLNRVIEVHIAGGYIEDNRYYIDAHELPILPETWTVFDHLLSKCSNLKAICVECEGASAQRIMPALMAVRQRVIMGGANAALRQRVRETLAGGLHS